MYQTFHFRRVNKRPMFAYVTPILFNFQSKRGFRWIANDSPLTFGYWNAPIYKAVQPIDYKMRITGHYYHDLKPLWKIGADRLHPRPIFFNVNKSMTDICSALFLALGEPVYVNIPCDEYIFHHWICQKPNNNTLLISNTFTSNITECPRRWYNHEGMCYNFTFGHKKCPDSLHVSTGLKHCPKIVHQYYLTIHHWIKQVHFICDGVLHDDKGVTENIYYNTGVAKISASYNYTLVCHHVEKASYITQCPLGFYTCRDASCISDIFVCDGKADCPDGEEETESICSCTYLSKVIYNSKFCSEECHPDTCSCSTQLFKQDMDGGCKAYIGKYRDGNSYKSNVQDIFVCNEDTGQFIPSVYKDDLIPDCENDADEKEYQHILTQDGPWPNKCSLPYLSCMLGHSKCFNIQNMCEYELDQYNNIKYCRNGAHLWHCKEFPCSNSFKCFHSYCVA